ncbi:MAG: class D sortase [Anaerolineae bacterium]|nr:class D sortase [Anaerolineae bacterium]
MRDKRTVDELSIEELEIILAIKKREARQARLRSMSQRGRVVGASPEDNNRPIPEPHLHEIVAPDAPQAFDTTAEMPRWEGDPPPAPAPPAEPKRSRIVRPLAERRARVQRRARHDRVLLAVEVGALVAFLGLMAGMVFYVLYVIDATNRELDLSAALPTPTITPEITLDIVLPGGHTSPGSPGGARPNLDEIPEHLRPVVQARLEAPVVIPTPGAMSPVNIRIAAINVNHRVVIGDDPEALKHGVGHHIGSANPGMHGNMVLSAHNDIYGEIFRELDVLEPGDEVVVSTMAQDYRYVVRETRIVGPRDTWVMAPTQSATLTLISCYPYWVDTHRIVVFADLVEQ